MHGLAPLLLPLLLSGASLDGPARPEPLLRLLAAYHAGPSPQQLEAVVPGDAVPVLQALLQRPDLLRLAKRHAIAALGSLGSPTAAAALQQVLQDPAQPGRLRLAALMALAHHYAADPATLRAVLASLDDPEASVQKGALVALSLLPQPSARRALQGRAMGPLTPVLRDAVQSALRPGRAP